MKKLAVMSKTLVVITTIVGRVIVDRRQSGKPIGCSES